MQSRAVDKLDTVNARLTRARQEYRTALETERKAKQFSQILPKSANAQNPVESAHHRVWLAAQEFELALDEFIKFTMTNQRAARRHR